MRILFVLAILVNTYMASVNPEDVLVYLFLNALILPTLVYPPKDR